jgi:hypothetical protein
MTTITATGHQRTPLIAALATGVALVVGGAIGVAWEQDNSTPAATHAPAYLHSYARYFYWVAPTTSDELSGSPGAATTSDEFSGTTHPYPATSSTPTTGSPDGYTTSQECRGCRR